MRITLTHVLTGEVSELAIGAPSGIHKRPVHGPIWITNTGIQGDQQADLKHHGGPEKAVHHYAFEHYSAWASEYPALKDILTAPGAFGENFSTVGMCEKNVHIGDVYRVGGALLQVSQGRQPCWKLGARFKLKKMPILVQETGRTGWYYRVLEEGQIEAGDQIELVERPRPEWSVSRLLNVFYHDMLNREELEQIVALHELTESWRINAQRRLDRGVVEDWTDRLNGVEK